MHIVGDIIYVLFIYTFTTPEILSPQNSSKLLILHLMDFSFGADLINFFAGEEALSTQLHLGDGYIFDLNAFVSAYKYNIQSYMC